MPKCYIPVSYKADRTWHIEMILRRKARWAKYQERTEELIWFPEITWFSEIAGRSKKVQVEERGTMTYKNGWARIF